MHAPVVFPAYESHCVPTNMDLISQVELYFYKNFNLMSSLIFLGKIQAKWTGLSCFNFNWVKKRDDPL